jgi:hypothetical protein
MPDRSRVMIQTKRDTLVKGDDPDKKGYPGPPGWGLGVRLITPPHKKIMLRDLKRRPRPIQGCRADDIYIYIYL